MRGRVCDIPTLNSSYKYDGAISMSKEEQKLPIKCASSRAKYAKGLSSSNEQEFTTYLLCVPSKRGQRSHKIAKSVFNDYQYRQTTRCNTKPGEGQSKRFWKKS